MFYILITMGLIFIFLGIYIDRKEIIDWIFFKLSAIRNKEEIGEMEAKIRELEMKLEETSEIEEKERIKEPILDEIILDDLIQELPFTDIEIESKEEIFEEKFEEVFEEAITEREELSLHNKLKTIDEYEKQGKSVEEICDLMDMKKGEILLLKKLYKKS